LPVIIHCFYDCAIVTHFYSHLEIRKMSCCTFRAFGRAFWKRSSWCFNSNCRCHFHFSKSVYCVKVYYEI